MKRKIYVASSWRNEHQPEVVAELRKLGHEVYDFRNPEEGKGGFHWSDIDPEWESWSGMEYVKGLNHDLALDGFNCDLDAMKWADTFVLVQPCGRSAHLEMGWAVGQGKTTVMLLSQKIEPELMIKMCDWICVDLCEVLEILELDEAANVVEEKPAILEMNKCPHCMKPLQHVQFPSSPAMIQCHHCKGTVTGFVQNGKTYIQGTRL